MTPAALGSAGIAQALTSTGLRLRAGPFTFCLRSSIPAVIAGVERLYGAYPRVAADDFIDFEVVLRASRGLRRWHLPQVRFFYDGASPFEPLPLSHALPLLEWSMNWCISTQAHQYLMLHAAVLAREGRALLLPAPPGSGKSTLCAALMHRGWQLLSDEVALIAPDSLAIQPLCRPVSLKNESIALISAFEPASVFSEVTRETSKGSVAHLQVPAAQLARIGEPALPAWIVFPRYSHGAAAALTPRSRPDTLLELGRNAFNYTLLGRVGFATLSDLVTASACYRFEYSQLDDAVAAFEALARFEPQ